LKILFDFIFFYLADAFSECIEMTRFGPLHQDDCHMEEGVSFPKEKDENGEETKTE